MLQIPADGTRFQRSSHYGSSSLQDDPGFDFEWLGDDCRPRSFSASAKLLTPTDSFGIAPFPEVLRIGRTRSSSVESPTPYIATLRLRRGLQPLKLDFAAEREQALSPCFQSSPKPAEAARELPGPTLTIGHSAPPIAHPAHFPPVPESCAGMSFLPQPWRFPSNVRYRKSVPGSLQSYSQRRFQNFVTAGYIIDDGVGLRWATNGKYLLLKCDEVKDSSSNMEQHASTTARGQAMYAHELFPQPNNAPAPVTDDSDTYTNHPRPIEEPQPQRRLPQIRSILKLRHHSSIPNIKSTPAPPTIPAPPLAYIPLPTPWNIPTGALYTEAYFNATRTLKTEAIAAHDLGGHRAKSLAPKEALELLVSSGHLIADAAGIRRAHTEEYLLHYAGQRDNNERIFTNTIRSWEPVSTPIVEDGGMQGKGGRRVRILGSCVSLNELGVVREERVKREDGEAWKYDAKWEGVREEGRVRS